VVRAESVLRELAASEDAVYPPEAALLQLARLLESQGRSDEARDTLREVVEAFAASPSAAEARAMLRRLDG
jgi:TolA-binding protein